MLDTRLRMCPACGAELPVRYANRCSCGLELPQPHEITPDVAAVAVDGVVDADELPEPDYQWLEVESAARALLSGGWLPGECWVVYGPGGSGKTRLSLRWSTRARATLACSLESPATVTTAIARSAGACVRQMAVTESSDWAQHIGRRRALVIDSLARYRDPVATVQAVSQWCHDTGGVAWLIGQVTADGAARGGPVLHECDAVMHVTPGSESGRARVVVEKRRLAPPGPSCELKLG